MSHTPFFPAWRPRLAALGRRAEPRCRLRHATLAQIETQLGPAVPPDLLRPPAAGDHSRQRVYGLYRTFWCWVWQILQANTSCREVVRQLQALLGVFQGAEIDSGTSAYCQARAKLPLALLEKIFAASARHAERRAPGSPLLQGRPLKVVDGSSVQLADTPKNRAALPPAAGPHPGSGFPCLRVGALFSAASGALLAYATGGTGTAELAVFVTGLRAALSPQDIVVGDRAYGVYVIAALLQRLGVDLVARVATRSRKVDFRRRTKALGPGDALFTWTKPGKISPLLPLAEWLGLPAEITVRLLRVRLDQPGFRTRDLTLVTTLLDPQLYPAGEVATAYARRWRLELCLDDLKTTLGMCHLHCRTPEMVAKELVMFLLAHNFLRGLLAETAQSHRVELERLSFKGGLDAFRQWSQALAQLGHTKNRRRRRARLWQRLLKILAADLVPERPGRQEPRAVKRRSKYPHLNKPRRLYRERWSRNKRRRLANARKNRPT